MAKAIHNDYDEFVYEDVRGWASLGGQCPRNAERDLHRWMHNKFGFKFAISWMDLTIWDPDSTDTIEVKWPYIEPYQLYHAIAKAGAYQISRSVVESGREDELQKFWEVVAENCDWFKRNPYRDLKDEWSVLVPVRSHGDEARFCKNDKLLVLTTGSAFVRGSSWDSKLIYTVIPHDFIVPGVTLDQLLRKNASSMKLLCAMDGLCPDGTG